VRTAALRWGFVNLFYRRHSAEGGAAQQLSLQEKGDEQNWQEIDCPDGGEHAPIDADIRAHDPSSPPERCAYRRLVQQQAEQKIVPGEDKGDDRRAAMRRASAAGRCAKRIFRSNCRRAAPPPRSGGATRRGSFSASRSQRQVERGIDKDDRDIAAAQTRHSEQKIKRHVAVIGGTIRKTRI